MVLSCKAKRIRLLPSKGASKRKPTKKRKDYCRRAVSAGDAGATTEEVRRDTAPGGGVGAATPAVCDPRPSFCKLSASSLPVGLSPCAAWNRRRAAAVSSSHLPLGIPAKEPSLASAAWISVTRSPVGAFCPGCLRERPLVRFPVRDEDAPRVADLVVVAPDFLREELLSALVLLSAAALLVAAFPAELWAVDVAALGALGFFFWAPLDCAELAGTPNPTALSSSRRAGSAGRRFRVIVGFSSTPLIGRCPLTLLLGVLGRNHARQEHGQDAVAVLPAQNLEHHVVSRLQLADDGLVLGN